MRWGYNTNGLAHHRWQDALELIAEAGYQSVALTVDHHCLNPFASGFRHELEKVRLRLEKLKLRCVVETGARFLLDPRRKHEPTLVTADRHARQTRLDFLERCVDMSAALQADGVSFWAGVVHQTEPRDLTVARLAAGVRHVCDYAAQRGVPLAFEPEPGMAIETMDQFAELQALVNHPQLGLTIDIGHVLCVEDQSISQVLRAWAPWIRNIHLEDMRRGIHEHLRFGEGEIDFPPVLATLAEIDYTGGVHVELSRHSHQAPEMLLESLQFLLRCVAPP